ncbi:ATP-binding protein [Neobacillus sp. FSL H8-0543]|uniref:ATP-binding protein n=1 Tax=Neobacillus sp. FSL H8-0543 TaxID=2954672 RepID=UPI003158C60F
MNEGINNPKLIYEEKKALNLFLWLFYITYIAYELLFYYIYPSFSNGGIIGNSDGVGPLAYVFIFGLIPVTMHFYKKGNPYIVKYLFVFTFIILDTVNSLMMYLGTDKTFAAGHIVEVLIVLFTPIFVNKRYFWTVSIVMIVKYVFVGIVLWEPLVLAPMGIYIILSLLAYAILNRFSSYINSITLAHNELRQKEKLAVIGQMATAIGHEIKNPLSSLRGFTQLQQERHPNTSEYAPIMIQEIDRINSIVNDLMYLGKPKVITFEKASIEEIITYTLSITKQKSESQGVMVDTIMEGPLPPLDCDANQLKQMFINLIKNAKESMPNGGKIRINVKVIEGKRMLISIQDEGCGIADEDILSLGEPFYTTKQDGTGLGLLVSNQIISDHHGKMTIDSSLDKGTTVNVIIPITQNNTRAK